MLYLCCVSLEGEHGEMCGLCLFLEVSNMLYNWLRFLTLSRFCSEGVLKSIANENVALALRLGGVIKNPGLSNVLYVIPT